MSTCACTVDVAMIPWQEDIARNYDFGVTYDTACRSALVHLKNI